MSPFITAAVAAVLPGCPAETKGIISLPTLKKRLIFDYRASQPQKTGICRYFHRIAIFSRGVLTKWKKCNSVLHVERVTRTDSSLVNLSEAARRLKISYVTLWRWVKKGKVTPVRILGLPYLTLEQIQSLKSEDGEEKEEAAQSN